MSEIYFTSSVLSSSLFDSSLSSFSLAEAEKEESLVDCLLKSEALDRELDVGLFSSAIISPSSSPSFVFWKVCGKERKDRSEGTCDLLGPAGV